MIDLASWSYFFIEVVIDLTINLSEIVSLAISGAILTQINIFIGFFRLFL